MPAAIFDLFARDDLEAADQRFGFRAVVRFDEADDDIDAGATLRGGGEQHLIGLADAGGGAEEHFQMPARLRRGFAQQCLRIGTFRLCVLLRHRSSAQAMLSFMFIAGRPCPAPD
jgi:hypothetical protein